MTTTVPKVAMTAAYTFTSQPRAVVPQRKKYREQQQQQQQSEELGSSQRYVNMMHDPRVVRGSTYRQMRSSGSMDETQKLNETQRRRRSSRCKDPSRQASPEPVPGRVHVDIQTELYLEELTNKVDEVDVEVQTDPFVDRPPTPLYIPPKTGVDKETQIAEGDLFDFDLEVQPILEVLVGKTMEQALMEVMEEAELAQLRQHQRQFEELRAAELMEVQRLEEQARRRREEKIRRVQQQTTAAALEQETQEKIAARAFAQRYLTELLPSVFGVLEENGYLYDAQEHEVETEFMPWLETQVGEQMAQACTARSLLDNMLVDVIKQRRAEFSLPDDGPPPHELTELNQHHADEPTAPVSPQPIIAVLEAEPAPASEHTAEPLSAPDKAQTAEEAETAAGEGIAPDDSIDTAKDVTNSAVSEPSASEVAAEDLSVTEVTTDT